jgi:phytoene dehydrogenase-like protein
VNSVTARPVIIGGGHNGLVAAFYLARAGLRPLVLERREAVGGLAATHEVHPGYRVPTLAHATGPVRPDIEADMALAGRGLEVICPPVTSFTPLEDGRALVLSRDAWNSARNLASVSEHDASRFPEFESTLTRLAKAIATVMREPPVALEPRRAELWRALRTLRPLRALGREDGHRLARWAAMPVADFVEEWFETEALRATIATRGLFGVNLGPRSGGTTANLLIDAARQPLTPGAPCFIRGGPGALARAMADAAVDAGAEIRLSTEVAQIDAAHAGVRGIVLTTGERLETSLVLSNADPAQTFLRFVDPALLGPEFVARMQHYRTRGVVAKVNLALGTLPSFRAVNALPGGLHAAQALAGRILIAPGIDYLEQAFDASKYGEWSARPWLECTIPSVIDGTLAPAGRHVMSVYVQYAPYALRDGDWQAERGELQKAVLAVLEEYAPGLAGSIVAAETWTPLDIERDFGSTGGHPHHGDMALDQLYSMRPAPGSAQYRTPLPGLYLCGAGSHPGGGLTGANGAAGASAVLADLKASR